MQPTTHKLTSYSRCRPHHNRGYSYPFICTDGFIYVCIYVCMYVCTDAFMYIYIYICMSTFAWSSIAQFVSGHSVRWRFGVSDYQGPNPSFVRGRQPFSLWLKLIARVRASKLTTNLYIARARCESQPTVKWAECSLITGTGYRVQVFVWLLIA